MDGMQRSARWPAALLAAATLVVLLTCAAAWQLVRQERALHRQQQRERLENGASLVVRESERAWEQSAADARESLQFAWDERGLRRTAGAPLVWSPLPGGDSGAPGQWFATGESLEFGQQKPAEAIQIYSRLMAHSDAAVRAGALLRIARCQRALDRITDAAATYLRLVECGPVRLHGATAALVGRHERAALFERMGDSRTAAKERQQLKTLLEQAQVPVDRATFEFYSRGVQVDPAAIAWAEAAEVLFAWAREEPKGAALLDAGGRKFASDWTRTGEGGTARLVAFDSIRKKMAGTLAGTSIQWELTGGTGKPGGRDSLLRRPSETGLPWGILVSLPADSTPTGATVLLSGVFLAGMAILGAMYLAYRTIRRELRLAGMQSEFVAAVSHEFRTPITALTHLTDLLASGHTQEDRRAVYYEALSRETRRLRDMVENLLDFGRMEAGRYRYRPEVLNAEEFIREIVEDFRGQPVSQDHRVRFDPPPAAVEFAADRAALHRAFWNLLENAAKYSPGGTNITATAGLAGRWARLSVEDEGPGIAPEDRERIFQKFVRGSGASSDNVKGTGIGLAMVDAIARAHGGRVELESTPGSGSRFTILLPLERSHSWRASS